MAIETAVVTGTSPTTASPTTKSFESTGFGTPQAAIVICDFTTGGTGTAAGIMQSWGVTDGTNDYVLGCSCDDNIATSNTARCTENKLVMLEDPDNNEELIGVFSAWATNGLTISFTTNTSSAAYNLTVILIKGCTDVETWAKSMVVSSGDNPVTLSMSSKPNFLIGFSTATALPGQSAHIQNAVGFAHNSSTDTVTEYCTAWSSKDANGVEDCGVLTGAYFGARLFGGTILYTVSANTFTSGGFTLTTSGSSSSQYMLGIAMNTGDTDGVDISQVDSPTSTGTWDVTAAGFEPQLAIVAMNSCTTVGSSVSADPVTTGWGFYDGTTQACHAMDWDDVNTTMDVQTNYSSSNGLQLYQTGSTGGLFAEGSFTSFDSSGVNASFPTTVDGTARKWVVVSIKAPASGAISVPNGNLNLTAGTPKQTMLQIHKVPAHGT